MEQRKRGGGSLRRIMVYTHNSIGLGHAVRTMAVIDGMRRARPGVEWLVLSGTSAPQIFLDRGVEIVRLPGVRHALDVAGHPLLPRNLASFATGEIIAWRRRIIEECLARFNPDVIMIEHSPGGLMGEAEPLLAAGAARGPARGSPALIHLSRGIYRFAPRPVVAVDDHGALPPGDRILHLYDAFYVFDDKEVVDVNGEFFGNDPAVEAKIRYMGRICARNGDELSASRGSPGGGEGRSILLVLGRFGRVEELHPRIIDACRRLGLDGGREIVVVPDVYLAAEKLHALRTHPSCAGVRITPFVPHLVDFMAGADLVVCRAGYNMVNEVMLTGVKALIIPEAHPSGEQERRAASLSGDGLMVRDEDSCLSGDLEGDLAELMGQPDRPPCGDFDRFRIGRIMAGELEEILAGNGPAAGR